MVSVHRIELCLLHRNPACGDGCERKWIVQDSEAAAGSNPGRLSCVPRDAPAYGPALAVFAY